MGKRCKEDLRIMKINNWTKRMQDRVKWKLMKRRRFSNNKVVVLEEEEKINYFLSVLKFLTE
jgi:hypothetical protein